MNFETDPSIAKRMLPAILNPFFGILALSSVVLTFPIRTAVAAAPRTAAAAAPTNAPRALSSNRYLLIVETSRAMQKRSEGALKAVKDLFASNMDGQLRRGDTIGIWTYNDDLHAGQFPLQQWTPETHRAVANRALTYLSEQPFEKSANLDKAVAALDRVVKNSGLITIILISDGEQKVKGTPFDEKINKVYKLWEQEQQKARMPFVTVLRASKGTFTEHSVISAPWPVELPALPPEPQPVAKATTNSPATNAQKTIVPPLIVTGKKPSNVTPTNTIISPKAEDPPVTASQPNPLSEPGRVTEVVSNQPPSSKESPITPGVTSNTAAPYVAAQKLTPSAPEPVEPKGNEAATNPPAVASAPDPKSNAPAVNASASPGEDTPKAAAAGEKNSRATVPSSDVIAIVPEPFPMQKIVIIVGLLIAAAVVTVGLFSLRRPRATSHTSLITRSLERDK